MDFTIIVNPFCVRGRFNDLLEGLRKAVMLMVTVYYSNIIQICQKREKVT